ncbi:MAG: hypothetical protein JKX67_07465 [Colwellia sp.]|nr:hypothetical protein [Colwellia sp.]
MPWLFSCQSSSEHVNYSQAMINSLYLDQQFTKPALFEIESEQEIFMLDSEMITLVNEKLKFTNKNKKESR